MDMEMISYLVTAGVTALITYVLPKVARKTKNKVDDKVVAYLKEHQPEVLRAILEQLEKLDKDKPGPRAPSRDHRK